MPSFEDFIRKVADATDFPAIVARRVQLKRSGSRLKGLCPFHSERTPSFSVNPVEGLYHCFGCKRSGNVYTWMKEMEGLEFREALEQLAEAAGLEVPEFGPRESPKVRDQRQRLKRATAAAAQFFHRRLLSDEGAKGAREYLASRGIHSDTAKKYMLGYAPASLNALSVALGEQAVAGELNARSAGSQSTGETAIQPAGQTAAQPAANGPRFSQATLRTASLTRPPNTGGDGDEDFFRDRLMIPIADAQGAVVAFGGRVLPDGRGPKYINSAANPVYDKGSVLYNLHLAKPAIQRAGRVIVCEGYTDVIGFGMCGLDNAVATCGTALTEAHVRALTRFTKNVVLAFDADAAGEEATRRFQRWEQQYDLSVAVLELPDGADPGQLAAERPDKLKALVPAAVPLLKHLVSRLLPRLSIDGPTARSHATDEVAQLFAPYPPELVVDADLAPALDVLKVSPEVLRARVKSARADLLKSQQGRSGEQRTGSGGSAPPANDSDYVPPEDDGAYGAVDYGGDPGPNPYADPRSAAGGAASRSGSTRRQPLGHEQAQQRAQLERNAHLLHAVASHAEALSPYLLPELFAGATQQQLTDALARARELRFSQRGDDALSDVALGFRGALQREVAAALQVGKFDQVQQGKLLQSALIAAEGESTAELEAALADAVAWFVEARQRPHVEAGATADEAAKLVASEVDEWRNLLVTWAVEQLRQAVATT